MFHHFTGLLVFVQLFHKERLRFLVLGCVGFVGSFVFFGDDGRLHLHFTRAVCIQTLVYGDLYLSVLVFFTSVK